MTGLWHGDSHALNRVWSTVLEEMLTLFYPPFRADNDDELLDQTVVALRAYTEDLAGFSEEQLRRAWRGVRRTHKTERWPTIHAILDALGGHGEGRTSGGRRWATDDELARQQSLYGFAWLRLISEGEARHHRDQEEALKAGRIHRKELHPFLPKVAA